MQIVVRHQRNVLQQRVDTGRLRMLSWHQHEVLQDTPDTKRFLATTVVVLLPCRHRVYVHGVSLGARTNSNHFVGGEVKYVAYR